MAGIRPTRPQLRSRRKALNSYLLSTESSYSDLAKKFGVREDTVKKFLMNDTKTVRSHYNSSPGYKKLYNAAAKNNHTSDLRKMAKGEGQRYVDIPLNRETYFFNYRYRMNVPSQVISLRRKANNTLRADKAERQQFFQRAKQLQEYNRNVERDYNAVISRREKQALDFQQHSFEKGRPRGLNEFLATNPSEEEIQEYTDDVREDYHLTAEQVEALSGRILKYLLGE